MQDDVEERTARSIIRDFESYGYTKKEIIALADEVAAKGRDGDELLAYLSPESVELLKQRGGSGTINPATGLPEFRMMDADIARLRREAVIEQHLEDEKAFAKAPVAEAADGNTSIFKQAAQALAAEAKAAADAQAAADARGTADKAAVDAKAIADAKAAADAKAIADAKAAADAKATADKAAADKAATAKDMLDKIPVGKIAVPSPVTAPPVSSGPPPPPSGDFVPPYGEYGVPTSSDGKWLYSSGKWYPNEKISLPDMTPPSSTPVTPTPLAPTPPTALLPDPRSTTPPVARPAPVIPLTSVAPTALPQTNPNKALAENVLKMAVGRVEKDMQYDINGDGRITSADALAVLKGNTPRKSTTAPGLIGGPVEPRTVTGGPAAQPPLGAIKNIPISMPTVPTMPAYSSRGVGSVGPIGGGGNIPIYTPPAMPTGPMFGNPNMRIGGAATNNTSYFGLSPQTSTGLAPGSVAIGPASMPIAAARNTLNTIGANPNLSPGILGGQQNAGVTVDRLGNQILAPSPPPLMRTYAKGGEVDVAALLAQNTETLSDQEPEEVINNDPVGTAQKFLADLNSAGKASPTRQSIKRVKTSPGGGATSDKAMQLAYEDLAKGDLGVMKDRAPAARNTESARSQMEEIARIYQMKIRSSQERAKGLSANTFGAPTLEGATLTKSKLTKKRFKDGGEAKKSDAKKPKSSGFFSDLFKGSDDDFIEDIKNKAEKNKDYRAMLEYLQSRDAVPDVETGNLPYGRDAVFSALKLPIGSGTIKINKDIVGSKYKGGIGPSTLAHEMTHATDRQLEQQASRQSGIFKKGNNFTDAYEKLVGPGGMSSGEKRTELARKISPKWAAETKDYRSESPEIAAYGVGNYAGPTTTDVSSISRWDAPPHVDATAATEFQILLDLARRNSGNAVKRAEGSPVEGERAPELTGVNRVLDSIAKRLPADSFPTSVRTLLETVQGKKEPITESNFSPKELSVLRQLIESTGGRGNVQYDDYTKFMRQQQQEKGTIPGSIAPGPLSILDPIGNVQTTLGRFAYARDAEGNLVINDKYDFNPIRPMSGAYGALRNYAAEKIPPGKGREVRINLGKPVDRAEGSPEEGEESLDQYYAPKARPSTGLNRKKGPISQALDSGDAYVNMAKGVTEMPYNLAGGPMDLVMLARQALTGEAPAGQVGTSDYIKRKMTELGIRQEPPADPTAKGFYTAGDLLSNLANPAGVTRAGVKTAQKTGQAVGDAAKTLEDLTVGEVQRARVRKAGRKAQDIPDTAYDPLRERLEATGNLAYVVKKSGGNWVPGNVENALIPLKTPLVAGKTPIERLSSHEALLKDPSLNQDQLDRVQYHLGIVKGEVALDNWVDTNLTNYVKKQMGTPEDPVRKLAEEGITHFPPDDLEEYLLNYVEVAARREKAGFPEDAVGTSPQALLWEYRSDEAIRPRQMEETFTSRRYPGGTTMRKMLTSEPGGGWAAKVPGTETVNELQSLTTNAADIAPRLGLDHIMDVLREEVTTGRIRPEQLSKVSMADAVRLTHQYDQELAAKMNAARIATRQGLPVYKEYPKNYRWIQLNKPGSFAQESDAMGHSVRGYEPPRGHPDWVAGSGNSGRASYGHGGWEAIKSGEAKVYSLVDAKGEPHTTVEVAKGKHPIGYSLHDKSLKDGFPMTFEYNNENSFTKQGRYLPTGFDRFLPSINPEQRQLILNRAKELYRERDTSTTPTMKIMDAFQKAADEVIGELPGEVTQIKGKQNAAPKKEYLPFVQDFVKSGNWLDVQDLRNTGLVKVDANSEMATSFKEIGKPAPTYVTQDELTKLSTWRRAGGALNLLPEGFARGGAVLRRYNKGGAVDKNTAFIRAHS